MGGICNLRKLFELVNNCDFRNRIMIMVIVVDLCIFIIWILLFY